MGGCAGFYTYVSHELLADRPYVLGERSREHHDLFVMRGALEDGLHVCAHVDVLQALITLIHNEVPDMCHVQVLVISQLQQVI